MVDSDEGRAGQYLQGCAIEDLRHLLHGRQDGRGTGEELQGLKKQSTSGTLSRTRSQSQDQGEGCSRSVEL